MASKKWPAPYSREPASSWPSTRADIALVPDCSLVLPGQCCAFITRRADGRHRMSYVPPVSAVLLMMWTASAATSPGPTTRRMGSVARSSSRRLSRSSPRIDAERGVSTKPAAIRLTRIGASSSARLAMRVGNATGRGDSEASSWAACSRAAHEYQGAGRPDLFGGATCDLEREQQGLGETASRLL